MLLLEILWLKYHLLSLYLIYLVWHSSSERCVCMDWTTEDDMLSIHFLIRLYLDLNTWCISV